ncbi:MAG: hypothetical protein GQ540_03405 [Lutibacter sp.]|uniref:hypothetical protein n=1 Tax=Lutibacter sp. TaxID=1925666 RepID=UPI0019E67B86|nr:hypothetical protein [Lutibacter sp.]NOR27559.1 hypothetical protein [Lutibacter sp.]
MNKYYTIIKTDNFDIGGWGVKNCFFIKNDNYNTIWVPASNFKKPAKKQIEITKDIKESDCTGFSTNKESVVCSIDKKDIKNLIKFTHMALAPYIAFDKDHKIMKIQADEKRELYLNNIKDILSKYK